MQQHCNICSSSASSLLTGFRLQVRAFVKAVDGSGKQELNQSPLPFIESPMEPGMDVALQRKDAIIRVRNAQISALWDELHTRQPWKNALAGDLPIAFADSGKQTNQTKRLAVMGINTVCHPHPSALQVAAMHAEAPIV